MSYKKSPKNNYTHNKKDLDETFKKLQEGVKSVFTSKEYLRYLHILSLFHDYSLNNTILILMQMPNAVRVASKDTWKKTGCEVIENAKGIKVIVPIEHKFTTEVILKDRYGNPIIDSNGEVKKDTKEIKNLSYRLGRVYDISQTNGDLPTLSKELTTNSTVLEKAVEALIKSSFEVPVKYDARLTKNGANGYYSPNTKEIFLRADMSSAQTFKTLIHEVAHSYLHNNLKTDYDRSKAEIEAESVAYAVCDCLGIDTSDYSFGYVASWSRDKNLSELKSSLNRIRYTVNKLLDWVCNTTSIAF